MFSAGHKLKCNTPTNKNKEFHNCYFIRIIIFKHFSLSTAHRRCSWEQNNNSVRHSWQMTFSNRRLPQYLLCGRIEEELNLLAPQHPAASAARRGVWTGSNKTDLFTIHLIGLHWEDAAHWLLARSHRLYLSDLALDTVVPQNKVVVFFNAIDDKIPADFITNQLPPQGYFYIINNIKTSVEVR